MHPTSPPANLFCISCILPILNSESAKCCSTSDTAQNAAPTCFGCLFLNSDVIATRPSRALDMALTHDILQFKLQNNDLPVETVSKVEQVLMCYGLQNNITETFRSNVKPLLMFVSAAGDRLVAGLVMLTLASPLGVLYSCMMMGYYVLMLCN